MPAIECLQQASHAKCFTHVLCGWAQKEGEPVEEIHPGDVVWFEPNEKHWHGTIDKTGMTHIAIQENLDGKVVVWMEQVI